MNELDKQYIYLVTKQHQQTDSTSDDDAETLAYSPFFPNYFLAGYKSGSICLYYTGISECVCCWYSACDGGVKQIRWSPHRPAVFFVLDGKGRIHIWDLLNNHQAPSQIVAGSLKAPYIDYFALR